MNKFISYVGIRFDKLKNLIILIFSLINIYTFRRVEYLKWQIVLHFELKYLQSISYLNCIKWTGCYVSGLYLEGAAWDGDLGCLRGQDPKVLVTELPIMQIIPIETSKFKLHNTFKTPGKMYTCTEYVCVCVYMYICVYVYMCICVYVYMCICVYASESVCVCLCVRVCTLVLHCISNFGFWLFPLYINLQTINYSFCLPSFSSQYSTNSFTFSIFFCVYLFIFLTVVVRTVYVTQARRNAMGVGLVFEADLHMTSHASHWVLQGVCLCLNTDA